MPVDPAAVCDNCHSDEAATTLKQASNYADHMNREIMNSLGDSFDTVARTSRAVSQVFANSVNWWCKSSAWIATTGLQLAQAGSACRTPKDLNGLNQIAASGFADFMAMTVRELEQARSAQSLLFQPLLAEAADLPERMFRVATECDDGQIPAEQPKSTKTKSAPRWIDIREVA